MKNVLLYNIILCRSSYYILIIFTFEINQNFPEETFFGGNSHFNSLINNDRSTFWFDG